MILITGATGTVGSEVITALLPAQAGHIRVLTRNPGAVFPDGTPRVRARSLAWRQAGGTGLGSASGLGALVRQGGRTRASRPQDLPFAYCRCSAS
jgi:hypothetical protein